MESNYEWIICLLDRKCLMELIQSTQNKFQSYLRRFYGQSGKFIDPNNFFGASFMFLETKDIL